MKNTCHFIYTKGLYLCTVVRFCSGTQYFQPCQKCVTCAELHSPVHRYSTFDISYVFNEEFYKVYKKNWCGIQTNGNCNGNGNDGNANGNVMVVAVGLAIAMAMAMVMVMVMVMVVVVVVVVVVVIVLCNCNNDGNGHGHGHGSGSGNGNVYSNCAS